MYISFFLGGKGIFYSVCTLRDDDDNDDDYDDYDDDDDGIDENDDQQ